MLSNIDLYNYIKSNRNLKKILNLSSGGPIELFPLAEEPGFELLVNVDKLSMHDNLNSQVRPSFSDEDDSKWANYNHFEDKDDKSLYDYYEFSNKINNKTGINKIEFEQKVKYVESSIENFIKTHDNKYDLIIISKVLSHISQDIQTLKNLLFEISKFLNYNGCIFIKDNGEDFPLRHDGPFSSPLRKFTYDEFCDLISDYNVVVKPNKIRHTELVNYEEYWAIIKQNDCV